MSTNALLRKHERTPIGHEASHEELSELDDQRLVEIAQDPILEQLPADQREKAISDTFELYLKTKEYVAPVVTGFTDSLLKEAGQDKQIIFAARDGLGSFEAARALLKKFPEAYGGAQPEQLAYLYFTRAAVTNSWNMITDYVKQAGLNPEAPTLIADIGMYGSIMYDLVSLLPKAEARYIISRNPNIPGYAVDATKNLGMDCLYQISGNPAVHFLEDTFSGTTSSPARLIEVGGKIIPDMKEGLEAYGPDELMKRKYAITAFGDYVSLLDVPPAEEERPAQVHAMDEFLLEGAQYHHLMVPHIR